MKLKPCPFCGAEPHIDSRREDMFGEYDGDEISESEWDAAERQFLEDQDREAERPIDDDDIDWIDV
jgi:hypothetical protein